MAPTTTVESTVDAVHPDHGVSPDHQTIVDIMTDEKTNAASEDIADSTTQKTPVLTTQNTKAASGGTAEEDGSIQSGDAIFLKAHTGSYVDVQGGKVRARWNMQGDWQRMVITKEGGGTIWSEDTVFLRTHSGANLNVDGDTVEALSDETGPTQELVIEKEANDGAIWPGDVVFLTAHTGKCLDVQGAEVSARWAMRGPWQTFTIENATAPEEPVAVASEDASEDADTEEDPLMQWEKLGVVAQGSHGAAKNKLQKLSGPDHVKKDAKLSREQKASILSILGTGAIERFEARGTGALAQQALPRAADASRLATFAGLLSAGGLVLLLLARRRALQSTQGRAPGAAGYEYEEAPTSGSSRLLVGSTSTAPDVEVG